MVIESGEIIIILGQRKTFHVAIKVIVIAAACGFHCWYIYAYKYAEFI